MVGRARRGEMGAQKRAARAYAAGWIFRRRRGGSDGASALAGCLFTRFSSPWTDGRPTVAAVPNAPDMLTLLVFPYIFVLFPLSTLSDDTILLRQRTEQRRRVQGEARPHIGICTGSSRQETQLLRAILAN